MRVCALPNSRWWRIGLSGILALAGVSAGCRDQGPERRLVPAELRILSGAGQGDTIEARLPDTLVVEVRDSTGAVRPGLLVRFETQPAPDGRFGVLVAPWYSPGLQEVRTDESGRARAGLVLGTLAGHALVWVKVPALDLFDTVAVEVRPGAPATVTALPADTAVYAGAVFPLAVSIVDRAGNVRPDTPAVTASGPVDASPSTLRANGVGRGLVVLQAGGASATVGVSVVPHATIAGIFTGGAGGDQGIVIAELDGSGRRTLLEVGPQNPFPWGPMWAPDGSRIVYTPPYSNDEVRVVDLAGVVTRVVPLLDSGVWRMAWPQFSRDGAWIYFKGEIVPITGALHLYRVKPDGSGLERLTTDTMAALGVRSASPSPDGQKLVVWHTGSFDPLAIFDLGTRTWTELGVSGRAPRWSPVDDRIAFVAGAFPAALQVMHADGSGLRTLAPGITADGVDWSPDGQWLIARGPTSLVVVNAATGEQLPIPQFRDLVAATWRP